MLELILIEIFQMNDTIRERETNGDLTVAIIHWLLYVIMYTIKTLYKTDIN